MSASIGHRASYVYAIALGLFRATLISPTQVSTSVSSSTWTGYRGHRAACGRPAATLANGGYRPRGRHHDHNHNHRPMPGHLAACTLLAALAVCGGPAASAQAEPSTTIAPAPETFATLTPALSPDRLGAHGALTLTIHYTGGELGVPSPVRRAVLRLPVGLTLEIPSLRSCSPAHLEARGARGCPRQSEIGTGRALVEGNLGAQPITETATLRAFLGPLDNLQPTFEILGQGYSPIGQQMVLTATALPDRSPYGEQLVMSIPPIPTVPPEPDASITSFSLTIGTSSSHRAREANTVLIPSSCPAGGFPFAAEFTYADGSVGSALATIPCPR